LARAQQRLQTRLIPIPISNPQFFLQRQANFREETGNGLRVRVNRDEDHKPKTRKENQIMKNRKNILTNIIAAVAILVTSASSSLGVPPLQPPQNYTGSLTHGEFVSCDGQPLPPAYSVGGTWVLNIDAMTQAQVAPPAHLTMVVFRDGSIYLVFPYIELTPVSLQDGVYTYTWGTQVTATLDTNTTPATFAWHVVFDDNCTLRSYGSLTYFGVANN
jgi:hypothetical protein